MQLHDLFLVVAGTLGIVVAVIHGVIVQRKMAIPLQTLADRDVSFSRPIRLLIAPLLQFGTFSWLVCGVAVIGCTLWALPQTVLVIGLLAASHFAFGAVCNLLATRGRHPGGWLMLIAVVLILLSLINVGAR